MQILIIFWHFQWETSLIPHLQMCQLIFAYLTTIEYNSMFSDPENTAKTLRKQGKNISFMKFRHWVINKQIWPEYSPLRWNQNLREQDMWKCREKVRNVAIDDFFCMSFFKSLSLQSFNQILQKKLMLMGGGKTFSNKKYLVQLARRTTVRP